MWAFVALLAIPVIEIALFIQIGGLIGVWPTVLLVLAAALVGVALVRAHGTRTLAAVQATMRRGEDPGEPIFGAAMILIAAGLFITPGFLTDAMALILLVPAARSGLYRAVRARMNLRTTTIFSTQTEWRPEDRRRGNAAPADLVIDGEFEDVTQDKRATHQPSEWTRH